MKKLKRKSNKAKRSSGVCSVGSMPHNVQTNTKRICIAVPTTGLIRVEWMMARFGVTIPINWSQGAIFQYYNQFSPIDYVVADARNICCEYSLSNGFEWTFFIDHDVIIPADIMIKFGEYMREKKYPVISGLYYCKGSHPEPLIFRGRGNGYFPDWKFGDKVMVDGIPMGCVFIHNSVLKVMQAESQVYTVSSRLGPVVVRRIFETPSSSWLDPESGKYNSKSGTEDLPWCERVIERKVLKRAGWDRVADEKYPFLMDTSIFCQHIDNNGMSYPGLEYKNFPQYKDSKLKEKEEKGISIKGETKGSQY